MAGHSGTRDLPMRNGEWRRMSKRVENPSRSTEGQTEGAAQRVWKISGSREAADTASPRPQIVKVRARERPEIQRQCEITRDVHSGEMGFEDAGSEVRVTRDGRDSM